MQVGDKLLPVFNDHSGQILPLPLGRETKANGHLEKAQTNSPALYQNMEVVKKFIEPLLSTDSVCTEK